MNKVVRAAILAGFSASLLWLEQRRSLRRTQDSRLRRDVRNLAVASLAGVVTQLVEIPVALAVARETRLRKAGLLQIFPPRLQPLVAIALLDYTLYIWHRLTHRVPLLWRFHRVHHIDREMDASTALRFHCGEILLSVAFRAAQMRLLGPSAEMYQNWQSLLICSILFHHSNVRLPLAWERRVALVLMTPRLHAIHHSEQAELLNSNWSSGFTVWDWLHGTLRTGVPQTSIVIGVEGFRGDRSQQLDAILAHPFVHAAQVPGRPGGSHREPVSLLSA